LEIKNLGKNDYNIQSDNQNNQMIYIVLYIRRDLDFLLLYVNIVYVILWLILSDLSKKTDVSVMLSFGNVIGFSLAQCDHVISRNFPQHILWVFIFEKSVSFSNHITLLATLFLYFAIWGHFHEFNTNQKFTITPTQWQKRFSLGRLVSFYCYLYNF
jgi:hypothetical protein